MDPHTGQFTYYLAYGSNCHKGQMARRCPSAEPLGVTKLTHHQLRFCYHADIIEAPGQTVLCAVWKVHPRDEEALDDYEGYPGYYDKKIVKVMIPGVGMADAMVYVMAGERELCPPTRGYAEIIRIGYDEFGIPLHQMTSAPGYEENERPDPWANAWSEEEREQSPYRDEEPDSILETALMEIDMSPDNLRAKAATIDARGGMEFEMLVPANTIAANGTPQVNLRVLSQHFAAAVGRRCNYSQQYHRATRSPDAYCLEPDGSLVPDNVPGRNKHVGLEFITPVLPVPELFSDLAKVKNWAEHYQCYTNEKCGLHMNVSVPIPPGKTLQEKVNYVKLVLLVGDEDVLREYGRLGNEYCKSAMVKLREAARDPERCARVLAALQGDFLKRAGTILRARNAEKKESINVKTDYVEFRGPGGDWLSKPLDQLTNTFLRFVVALDAACDTNKYRRLYRQRLEELIGVHNARILVDLIDGADPRAVADDLINDPSSPLHASAGELGHDDFSAHAPETQMTINENSARERNKEFGFSKGDTVYFFAYDHYINEDLLLSVCPDAKLLGIGYLPNHVLEFRSLANVIPRQGGKVYGTVWAIKGRDVGALDVKYEVRQEGYTRKTATVPVQVKAVLGGKKVVDVPAIYYEFHPNAYNYRTDLAAPESRLKNAMLDAYRAHSGPLDNHQLQNAPGWTEPPKKFQQQRMVDLRPATRRARNAPSGGKVPGIEPQEELQEQRLDELFGQKYFYFAYGSNASRTQMKSRIGEVPVVGVGYLENYELEFHSVANVYPASGQKVWGVIYKLTARQIAELDRREGVDSGSYEKVMRPVKLARPTNGPPRTISALVYVMTEFTRTNLRKPAGPNASYIQRIKDGYAASHIPLEQIAQAKGINLPPNPAQERPVRELKQEFLQRQQQPAQEPEGDEGDGPENDETLQETHSMRRLMSLVEAKK